MSTDNETLVATIQLLLGDKPVTEKRNILRTAFPDDLIDVAADRAILISLIGLARDEMMSMQNDQLRGDTPLGKLALQNLGMKVSECVRYLNQIKLMLGA